MMKQPNTKRQTNKLDRIKLLFLRCTHALAAAIARGAQVLRGFVSDVVNGGKHPRERFLAVLPRAFQPAGLPANARSIELEASSRNVEQER